MPISYRFVLVGSRRAAANWMFHAGVDPKECFVVERAAQLWGWKIIDEITWLHDADGLPEYDAIREEVARIQARGKSGPEWALFIGGPRNGRGGWVRRGATDWLVLDQDEDVDNLTWSRSPWPLPPVATKITTYRRATYTVMERHGYVRRLAMVASDVDVNRDLHALEDARDWEGAEGQVIPDEDG